VTLLHVVLASGAFLAAAYVIYGRFLSRWLNLSPDAPTPAVQMRDGLDYEPIPPRYLLGQHFSAIAAAGPIVGPVLAGVMFGWAPALLWILLGAVFVGGFHDLTALVASVRHRARSIAEVVRENMSRTSYLLFLGFVWLTLVYILVAFTDITASSFVGVQTLENGQRVSGGGVATSSVLYLLLAVALGLILRFTKLPLLPATFLFLPLVALAIWYGQAAPLDLSALLGISQDTAHKVWDVLLLAYCFGAAVCPVWMLLQPRGHLGGYFLYAVLLAGAVGVAFGGRTVQFPAFLGWTTAKGDTLAPFLFITIACGACSGFHAIVASGTTSKQLRRETDARPVGYGSMLLEGMVAVVSLSCVMMLAQRAPALRDPKPNFIYAQGIGSFMGVVGIPAAFAVSFGLMAFTTFVYDTLDVCTRLGRYIMQELTGWKDRRGAAFATAVTAAAPLSFLLQTARDASGAVIPAWKVFWGLFGASNQLLSALALLCITVWLWRTKRSPLVWLVTGAPTVLMFVMSTWALGSIVTRSLGAPGVNVAVPAVALVLMLLAALMLVEGVRALAAPRSSPQAQPATP